MAVVATIATISTARRVNDFSIRSVFSIALSECHCGDDRRGVVEE